LAPKGILEKISRYFHNFLWEGGKSNTKKFHLINWHIVCQPSDKGGLAIQNPSLVNVSLGAKLAWHLISGPPDWWKSVLSAKYFSVPHLHGFDAPLLPILMDHQFGGF
jgi:hypothetical protein